MRSPLLRLARIRETAAAAGIGVSSWSLAWGQPQPAPYPAQPAAQPPPSSYPPSYPGAAQPPTAQPLEAGGLAPPPAPPRSAESVQTEATLERAEREDSHRGLEFVWVNAEFGYQYVNLQALSSGDVVDGEAIDEATSGLTYGIGVGVRIIIFTAGARFRLATMSAWDVWSLDAEVGLHVPFGPFEPYAVLAAGYSSVGNFSVSDTTGFDTSEIDITGFNTRLGVGFDWYATKVFSIGVNLSGEALFTSRNGATTATLDPELADLYSIDGDGIGLGLGANLVAGLHF